MAAAVEVVRSGKTEILVVSMGHEGAVMATVEGAIRMVPPTVDAISAVGAGDSFVGAMTFGLSRGLMPRRAFEVGMAAGTAAVTTPGTELCRKADVEALLRRMHLERQQQGEAVLRELVLEAAATAA
jgi:6-phosphofructokinase 2